MAPSSLRRDGRNQACLCEALEARMAFDATLPHVAYYPEGYSSGSINEFVPISNPHEVEVAYELHARYEWGQRDQLIASGVIAPSARGGVTISDAQRPEDRVVRGDTPYALVLRSSLPLAAQFSHYDFGTAIGEAFTSTTSRAWSFGEGRRDSDLSRDFVLVYNPGDDAVEVELTAYGEDRSMTTVRQRIEGQRRGGWSMEDVPGLSRGLHSIRLVSSGPVVAAQSRYELQTGRGYGAVGTPEGGATAGVLPAVSFDDSFYDRNGDDSSSDHARRFPRSAGQASISILNAGATVANVRLVFLSESDDGRVERLVRVDPSSRTTISMREAALFLGDDQVAAVYTSDVPVTVTGAVFQGQDATGVEAGTIAATQWSFGEGYMSRARAGRGVLEELYIFNPGRGELRVSIDLLLSDGRVLTFTESTDGLEVDDFKLHEELPRLMTREDLWFGVRVRASRPIVAMMEHWDGGNGGGFSTFGMPSGTVVNLRDVLAI
ncbi:MAG: DUF5719 family protein [Planctomycetota bacterium]|nr:DUF5719 family protein [Planctomycetota bacterium]